MLSDLEDHLKAFCVATHFVPAVTAGYLKHIVMHSLPQWSSQNHGPPNTYIDICTYIYIYICAHTHTRIVVV